MSWVLFGMFVIAMFVALLVLVEEHMERRRRVRRQLRIIERYGNKPW